MNDIAVSPLKEGDIFHAECDNGGRFICIVNGVDHEHIISRTITTQEVIIFNISTGETVDNTSKFTCRIDGTKKLPHDLIRIVLQIDKKYRLMNAPEGSRLLSEEIYGMLSIDEFYKNNH